MRRFSISRYLGKYYRVVAIVSILAGALFYAYVQKRVQTYSATTVIEYTGDKAADGYNPDGTVLDVSEIYSSDIVSQALDSIGSTDSADTIRKGITVEPVISDEEYNKYDSKLQAGEDYEIHATKYTVTLTSPQENGKEYPRRVLNAILDAYTSYYGETYVNTSGGVDGLDGITDSSIDYIEMAEEVDSALTEAMDVLSKKIDSDDTFRSSRTGYSFTDIYNRFQLLRDDRTSVLLADILYYRVTKDRDVLIAKYENRNEELAVENKSAKSTVSDIRDVLDEYVTKMRDSGNTDLEGDGVLDDVYDKDSEDGTDLTTEYDSLLESYVDKEDTYKSNKIDEAYNKFVCSVFRSGDPADSTQEAETKAELEALVEEAGEMFDIFSDTNDEYNGYLGAQYISVLSNVGVTEALPVKKFTILVVLVFGLLGAAGSIIAGRIGDIIDYALYTNRADGLPNRVKCDRHIAGLSKRVLPEHFAAALFQFMNLAEFNAREGHDGGDAAMRTFADALRGAFGADAFIGNNGGGQYIVLAPGVTPDQLAYRIQYFATMVREKGPGIGYRYGSAVSTEEGCYDIRRLIVLAAGSMGRAGT